jgi:hypothetical protein
MDLLLDLSNSKFFFSDKVNKRGRVKIVISRQIDDAEMVNHVHSTGAFEDNKIRYGQMNNYKILT